MNKAPLHIEIAEAPENGKAYWLHADDGVRLRVGLWRSKEPQNGTIFIFPGRTENIEKYGRTITDLQGYGFATFVIDWRGQGLSDRVSCDPMKGHVDQFSDYQKDVAAMVEAAEDLDLPKPWFLMGHSLGASIGLRAMIEGLPVSACAFTGPMWGINLPAFKRTLAWPLAWAAQALGKKHIYAPGTDGTSYVMKTRFQENRLTNDPDMYQYYIKQIKALPDLQLGGLSIGWLYETLKETKALSKMPSPNIPCITFCGDHDEVVDIRAIQDRMTRWANGKYVVLKNSKHDVLSEMPQIRETVNKRICSLFSTASTGITEAT